MICDLPDPGISASTKLYSAEFYGTVSEALAADGRLVVHAGPPLARPRTFWTVDASMRAAGLHPRPYRISGRSSGFAVGPDRAGGGADGDRGWGFLLAGTATRPTLGLASDGPALRSLSVPGLLDAGAWPRPGGCRAWRRRRWCTRATGRSGEAVASHRGVRKR